MAVHYYNFWLSFFQGAGIPPEFDEAFAQAFSEFRIPPEKLLELDKETVFAEMGVLAKGDRFALIRHALLVNEKLNLSEIAASLEVEGNSELGDILNGSAELDESGNKKEPEKHHPDTQNARSPPSLSPLSSSFQPPLPLTPPPFVPPLPSEPPPPLPPLPLSPPPRIQIASSVKFVNTEPTRVTNGGWGSHHGFPQMSRKTGRQSRKRNSKTLPKPSVSLSLKGYVPREISLHEPDPDPLEFEMGWRHIMEMQQYLFANQEPTEYPPRPKKSQEEPPPGGIKRVFIFDEPRDEMALKLDVPLGSNNVGYKMLKRMGWNTGTSLGNRNDGIKVPIKVELRKERTGLGAETEPNHFQCLPKTSVKFISSNPEVRNLSLQDLPDNGSIEMQDPTSLVVSPPMLHDTAEFGTGTWIDWMRNGTCRNTNNFSSGAQ